MFSYITALAIQYRAVLYNTDCQYLVNSTIQYRSVLYNTDADIYCKQDSGVTVGVTPPLSDWSGVTEVGLGLMLI